MKLKPSLNLLIRLLPALAILFFSSCESNPDSSVSIEISDEMVEPKQYIIAKTPEALVIDGLANEDSWNNAPFSTSFIDIEGEKVPRYDTKMKMLWDDNYLYVYALMEEPHVWGDITKRDAVIFYNNDFEVFVDPSGTTKNYCEIEINALGTVWDLHLDQPYRNSGRANDFWNLTELKTAIAIDGTLNDPSDIDTGWAVEMAIPMDALAEFKNSPGPLPSEGEHWRINFSRVEWDHEIMDGVYQRKKGTDGKYLPEYNWVWSNQNVINMHEPEKWGVLQFTNQASPQEVALIEDEFLTIKQVAFALYRETKNGELKHLTQSKVGNQIAVIAKFSSNDSIQATFNKTLFGFEYKIPFGDVSFLINETGTLKKIE